jgi:fatty acid desaturase
MARAITLTDPTFKPKSEHNFIDRFFLKLINDERDLPFIHLSLGITFVLMPCAAALFVPGVFRWWMGPIYWAILFGLFFDRYILMLHNTSHRRLFKRKYRFFNYYIPWVLGPFCGESPETYYVHHITMHHAEGNLPTDLSSTMRFQRDNFFHFLRYFFRFFFLAIFELGAYQLKKKRSPILRRMLYGELSFYAACAGLAYLNWQATLVVFIIPWLLCRFLMMAGNWGQHAFVDRDDPGNSYRNSITCINAKYNRRCFNDGYHIGHHVMANRHWTDLPQDFLDDRKSYLDNDAIVFEDTDFFMVWFALMFRNYKYLAKHYVNLHEEERSEEEIIAHLKERTRQIQVA